MSIGINRLCRNKHGVSNSGIAIGLDFGLVAPRKKLGNAYIRFDSRDDITLLTDTCIDTLNKLFVCEWEVAGASGLKFGIL